MSGVYERLGFVASRLVRHGAEHDDAKSAPGDLEAGFVLMAGERVVLRSGTTALLRAADLDRIPTRSLAIHLGRIDGRAVHAVACDPDGADAFPEPDFAIRDLRALALEGCVAPDELGLVATAKSLLSWHARNGFCANCGSRTEIAAGGARRECPACGTHHFPRTDPVAIMLVHRGDRCLIGRGAHFPGTMYSCLAGFVEPGETIEAAVRRETMEETGIRVGAVRYRASQPWPFPSSLMIGCVAEALSDAITIDPVELAAARWVSRDELALMFAERHPEGITAPKPLAIAHLLLREFLDGTPYTPGA